MEDVLDVKNIYVVPNDDQSFFLLTQNYWPSNWVFFPNCTLCNYDDLKRIDLLPKILCMDGLMKVTTSLFNKNYTRCIVQSTPLFMLSLYTTILVQIFPQVFVCLSLSLSRTHTTHTFPPIPLIPFAQKYIHTLNLIIKIR